LAVELRPRRPSSRRAAEPVEPDAMTTNLSIDEPAYSTPMGDMFWRDAYDVLLYLVKKDIRVKLIVTSPPSHCS